MLEKYEINTEKLRQEILKKHSPLFDPTNGLFQLAEDMMNTGKIQRGTSLYEVIAFLFGKAYKTFEAIDILCQRGYGQDAAILARSLFEVLVNARYLARGDDTRTNMYINYWTVQLTKRINQYETDIKNGKIPNDVEWTAPLKDKRIEEIRRNYEKVKHLYDNNRRKDTWSGKSLREMAEEVDLYAQYYAYSIFSDKVHSNSSSIQDYINFSSEGMIMESGSSETLLPEVILLSSGYFLNVLQVVDQTFQIGFDTRMEEIQKLLVKIKKDLSDTLSNSP